MSALKGLDRNGLFIISSNVNMRGHEIKPVKSTLEQAKGIVLQVIENKPVELHQNILNTKNLHDFKGRLGQDWEERSNPKILNLPTSISNSRSAACQ